tara:strand:- start:461 stop:796 length:336 start_codon:yes stop_codon:yes gene_type:complete
MSWAAIGATAISLVATGISKHKQKKDQEKLDAEYAEQEEEDKVAEELAMQQAKEKEEKEIADKEKKDKHWDYQKSFEEELVTEEPSYGKSTFNQNTMKQFGALSGAYKSEG